LPFSLRRLRWCRTRDYRFGSVTEATTGHEPREEPVMGRLEDKIAIVTGGGQGIGQAIAGKLAAEGATVVVTDLDEASAKETADALPGAVAIRADVTDRQGVQAMVSRVVQQFGRVDVLVNNAGVSTSAPATREDPDEFRRVVDVNLNGAYWMAQACGRVMKPGSTIINIGSVLGFTTDRGLPQAAYCSTKAAILGLTRELAQQWGGRKGIRVNNLAPGYFPSEMTDQLPADYLAEMMQRRVPMQRTGTLDELTPALVFLASDASSYINGATLAVDGGLLAG
jgi:NAD(P)-dependent dehydrogenase (short-subunit alcohol dehydrogenase family)